MALYLDVGQDDVLRVGETYIMVERKSGARARLKIIGKTEVELMKKERLKPLTAGANTPAINTGD